ncbi:hypothetical protein [Pseudomonas sp. PS01301]|uniref:hypothetical protein n=1 Tax=Pseudomonas sp. PS01301 TaxID=2991437 RepID=UPI00249B93C7|nr:hypothetical protein [Pseudomonas sp. PS01301]
MQPARQDLPVVPGATYRDTIRIMQPVFVYRDITGIGGAPVVLQVPDHGLASDWPVWVRGVVGMPDLNREPQRQRPHAAKRIGDDTIEINALSAVDLRPKGGQIIYRKPVDLSGALVSMEIHRADDLVLVLGIGTGLRVAAPGTIERVLTSSQTELLTGDDLTYTLDVIYANGPTITRYFTGTVGKSTCCEPSEQQIVTTGEQGPPGLGAAELSTDPNNRLTFGRDLKLYVSDDLIPDPLAYYILAKG